MVAVALLGCGSAAADAAPATVPGVVVVGYGPHADARAQATTASARKGRPAPRVRVLHVARGRVSATIARLRGRRGVAYAVPDPVAHAADATTATDTTTAPTTPPPPGLPNDPGLPALGGLLATQWNFFGPWGIDAIPAWANAASAGHPGADDVRIAVLDTGVAYRDDGRYRRSPDFGGTRFVAPYDFVADDRVALDRDPYGHGTHVTGTIAETTGNGIGVSGLAWRAQIMPLRVLDAEGRGDAVTIARGVRYAVAHGARIINMSLEFPLTVTGRQMPELLDAIHEAYDHGVLVVAATGNDSRARVAYPARDSDTLAVGATTDDGCLASFSNDGPGIGLVAPGGGPDASLVRDLHCRHGHVGTNIIQTTYADGDPADFGLATDFDGTSMAAPHVTGTAALVIASGVLGPHPTPAQLECRLKATARPLGLAGPNRVYGYGLLDAATATSLATVTPQCAPG